jgi:phenylacetate-CoA ligase
MPAYFDAKETRDPAAREKALFAALRRHLEAVQGKAPTLRRQLKGVAVKGLIDRAGLQQVPVLRKPELAAMQKERAPCSLLDSARATSPITASATI